MTNQLANSETDVCKDRVLIIDDDRDFAEGTDRLLRTRGYDTRLAHNMDQALQAIQGFEADVALLDIRLGKENGLGLIGELRRVREDILCVIVTAFADIETAIAAVHEDAFDYLQKPVDPRDLLALLDRCSCHQRLVREKRSLEAQLREAQKMEAIGRLAGGVAHDFNNLLQVILANVELGCESLQSEVDASEVMNQFHQIELASQQASALTRQLLAFSRQETVHPEVLSPGQVVGDTERMLRRLIGEDVRSRVDLGPNIKCVRADAGQLEQAILNLAINARDAMPNGGDLEIKVANIELDEAHCAAYPDASPGPHVMLSVRDTGCGMDKHTMERMFEPFFTTKPLGKGTGLGLSTVFGIVRQSKGHIEVKSVPGDGTTFRIYLPAVEPPQRAAGAQSHQRGVGGSETILLCEDNEQIRNLASNALQRQGYTVIGAASRGQAVSSASDHNGTIDLLLTDVVLPDGNGKSVAEEVRKRFPDTEVLYMSGYTADVIARHGGLEAGVECLDKPFNMRTLLARIRDLLDRKCVKESRA